LVASGLARTYANGDARVQALRGVDLTLHAGELVAVMGPSGCGKSTLLHLLGGLDRPSAGTLTLNGQDVTRLSETRWARLRRREIGFVFQFFNLIGNLSVADNIELPGLLAGLAPAEARTRRAALLDELGLADKAGALPAQLSGGQQQRVALARALLNRPTLLLADEPTGNLDSAATRDTLALLQRYNAAGQTMLLVTHDARVASIAERVITLRDGLIVDETTLAGRERPGAVLAELISLEV
jgi:putative ABC transport system ATP-binding protein